MSHAVLEPAHCTFCTSASVVYFSFSPSSSISISLKMRNHPPVCCWFDRRSSDEILICITVIYYFYYFYFFFVPPPPRPLLITNIQQQQHWRSKANPLSRFDCPFFCINRFTISFQWPAAPSSDWCIGQRCRSYLPFQLEHFYFFWQCSVSVSVIVWPQSAHWPTAAAELRTKDNLAIWWLFF